MADPVRTVAHTGVAELHHEPSAFGITAPGWVALSMLVVLAIMLWQKVPALVARMLDARIATIRSQLDEASVLRAEAERLLADAKARDAASAGDAAAIVAHAEAEAAQVRAKAEADSVELIARRGKMAEDKIAAAERARDRRSARACGGCCGEGGGVDHRRQARRDGGPRNGGPCDRGHRPPELT